MSEPVVVDLVAEEGTGRGVTGWGWECLACGRSGRPQSRPGAIADAAAHAQEKVHRGFDGWRLGVDRLVR